MIYTVFKRFGAAHTGYAGSVEASTAKEAFKIAVQKYFEEKHYQKYTAFYVNTFEEVVDDFDKGYGYDSYGHESYGKGVMMAQKWIIDNAYDQTNTNISKD